MTFEQEKILKSENDTHEFVAYFQKEIETKDGTISNLNEEIIRKEVIRKYVLVTQRGGVALKKGKLSKILILFINPFGNWI